MKPHLRLYTNGTIYLWRGKLYGWKWVGNTFNGHMWLRRTGWPTKPANRKGAYS